MKNWCLVTGASGGIGLELAHIFAANSSVAPGFADKGFWFGNLGGLLLFFVVPYEIMFTFNLAMLLVSANEIQSQKKMGKFAAVSSKKNNKRKQVLSGSDEEEQKIFKLLYGRVKKSLEDYKEYKERVRLYVGLTVLMGAPWVFAALVDLSIVFDILFNVCNSLQGLFIFLAFDCKKKVLRNSKAALSGRSVDSRSLYSDTSSSEGGGKSKKRRKKDRGESNSSRITSTTYVSQDVDLRLLNEKVNDEKAAQLSFEISQKIQTDMTYPGQVKITVIRETRAVNIAK